MVKLLTHPGDLYVPPLDIWLDPGRRKRFAFVSHAHADHTGKHRSIVASAPTARLMLHRMNVDVDRVLNYRERTPIHEGHMTLYPSGHILGSAQALIECKGERLVYTGDFKLKPSRTAEPCEILPCDHLVMECTYGQPRYRFPDRAQVEADLMGFVESLLAKKQAPLVLAYALGRAQELIRLFADHGFTVAVENRIFDMTKIYEELGVPIGPYDRFDPQDYEGRVLIFPPHLSKAPVLAAIRDKCTIAVTGWAVDGRQNAWYRSDAAFPLSDHADFDDLLRYVEQARPKVVYLVHGFEDFADHLRRLNVETRVISGIAS